MPLPPPLDDKVRKQLIRILNRAMIAPTEEVDLFIQLRTELYAVMDLIDPNHRHFQRLRDELSQLNPQNCSGLSPYVKALDESYRAGMFDSAKQAIEATVMTDYLAQAEMLLAGGGTGEFSHVPAAVLAGAILEDKLRRLCQQQIPPIDTLKPGGIYKTLDPLITDLQQANVFTKAKADQLKSWAKIRNYAAHGEFKQFNRADVEPMITGIKAFIADYL